MTHSKIKFRPYQERDFKALCSYLDKGESVMYQLPTGGGKSVIIAGAVEKDKQKRTLFIAHRRELLFQMTRRLRELGLQVGLIVGDIKEEVDSSILVISIQTLVRGQFGLLDESWDRIIVDEAHRLRTPSYDKVLDKMLEVNPKLEILGVTATPYRADKLDFKKYINNMVVSDDVATLVQNGFLAKPVTYSINIGDVDAEVVKDSGDYQIQSLSTYMRKPKYLQALVDLYKQRGEERQMLIFAVDKKHALSIMEVYKANEYTKLGYIDAETQPSVREKILRDYEKRDVQIIISIETMTEGVDLPDTGCIQCARPTESIVLYSQMMGRGMRLKSDVPDLIILDCAGNTQKHGTVTSPRHWSLDPLINPKLISKKNKVVGKRADGTYTENVEELDYLELVEMTPEEYLINISGNVEKSEEFNREVDRQIGQTVLSLGELILKKAKVTDFICGEVDKYELDKIYFIQKDKPKGQGGTISIEIERINGQYQYRLQPSPASSYNFSEAKDFRYLDFYISYVEIYKAVLSPEILNRLKSLKTEVKELEDSKVDINDLFRKVQQFKREQFFKELNAELAHTMEFTFEKKIYLGGFRDLWGYSNKVRFDRPKLLSNHVVEFFENDSSRGTYSYMDRTKLIEYIYPVWDTRVKAEQAVVS